MEILGEECVTHTGVLRNPKWISLSIAVHELRLVECVVLSFRAQQATRLLNGPPHFRSGIFLFRGVTREREEEEKRS